MREYHWSCSDPQSGIGGGISTTSLLDGGGGGALKFRAYDDGQGRQPPVAAGGGGGRFSESCAAGTSLDSDVRPSIIFVVSSFVMYNNIIA